MVLTVSSPRVRPIPAFQGQPSRSLFAAPRFQGAQTSTPATGTETPLPRWKKRLRRFFYPARVLWGKIVAGLTAILQRLAHVPLVQRLRFGAGPYVALIDAKTPKTYDINGDGIPDLDHTTLLERLLKADHPGVKVTLYPLGKEPLKTHSVAQQLKQLQKDMAWGHKVDAVNFSFGSTQSLDYYLVGEEGDFMKPDELGGYRDTLLETFRDGQDPFLREQAQDIELLGSIARKIPFYVSSSNEGPRSFNLHTLAKGIITVGANTAKGDLASYTGKNNLVNRFVQGTFGITHVKGGYDINGDGIADIREDEVSKGAPLVNRFIGKAVGEVMMTGADVETLMADGAAGNPIAQNPILQNKLYPLAVLKAFHVIDGETETRYRSFGDYVTLQQGKILAGFRKAPDGIIQYDPDHSGRPGMVSVFSGCSFAVPKAITTDLRQKYPAGNRRT